MIALDGSVSNAGSSPSSTMPDKEVINCVVSNFYNLKFPPPDGGIVRVTYPIAFDVEKTGEE